MRHRGGVGQHKAERGATMRRELTAEQRARSEERKARFRELVKRFAEMPKEEREKWAAEAGIVVTCEGRTLSPRNTVLCYFQRQGVSMVGGFRQWLRQGRCVQKGEHGMTILVPMLPRRTGDDARDGEAETMAEDRGLHFIAATVFDVSQTAPIEAPAVVENPQGELALV